MTAIVPLTDSDYRIADTVINPTNDADTASKRMTRPVSLGRMLLLAASLVLAQAAIAQESVRNCGAPPKGSGEAWWQEYADWCNACGGTVSPTDRTCRIGANWGRNAAPSPLPAELVGRWTLTGRCGVSSASFTYEITAVTNGALAMTGGSWNCRFESGRIAGRQITMSCSNWLNKVDYQGSLVSEGRMDGTFTQRLMSGTCQWFAVKEGSAPAENQAAAPDVASTKPSFFRKKSAGAPSGLFAKSGSEYRTPPAAARVPVTAVPAAGLYRLDARLGFDTLDGAVFDSAQHTLTVYGHAAHPGKVADRHYLALLADALEAERPILSLEWTPESEAQVDRAMAWFADDRNNEAITSRLAKTFDDSGRVIPQAVAFYKALGVDLRVGMNKYEFNAAMLAAAGRPGAADALRSLGTWVEAARRGDIQARNAAVQDLSRVLGDYDFIAGVAAEYRAGRISAENMIDRVWPRLLTDLAHAFGWSEAPYVQKYWNSRRAGMSLDDATAEAMYLIQVDLNNLPRQALDAVMAKREEIVLPPEVMRQVLGSEPVVHAVVSGMPERGRLAAVAFDADYFAKTLFDSPDLSARVPGYKGYFAWLRARNEHPVSEQGHLWISPGEFELVESSDQHTLRFSRAPMKFHIESYAAGRRSVARPQLSAYADLLTAVYDDIGRQYPVLEDLREAAKVVAVARWLRQRGYQAYLPRAGREVVMLPPQVPGVLYMVMAVKKGPSGAILTAAGGIDYAGEGKPRVLREDAATRFTRIGDEVGQTVRKRLEQALGHPLDAPQPQAVASVNSEDRDGRRETRVTLSVGPEIRDAPADVAIGPGEQAFQLWKAGDLDAAHAAYAKLIAAAGSDPVYQAYLLTLDAEILHEKGDQAAAKAELQKAASLAPNQEMLKIMRAKAEADSGNLASALAIMREVVASDPTNAAARRVRDDLEARLAGKPAGGAGTVTVPSGDSRPGQLSPWPQATVASPPLNGPLEALRADELRDLRSPGKVRITSHAPGWVHYEGRNPEILELQTRRDALLSEGRQKEEKAASLLQAVQGTKDEKARESLRAEAGKLKDEAGEAATRAEAIDAEMRQHLDVDTRVEEPAQGDGLPPPGSPRMEAQ